MVVSSSADKFKCKQKPPGHSPGGCGLYRFKPTRHDAEVRPGTRVLVIVVVPVVMLIAGIIDKILRSD